MGQWRPYVLPGAPGLSEPEFRFALRRAAREFCRMAWVWRSEPQTFDLVAGQGRYTPTLPAQAEIAKALEVYGSVSGQWEPLDPCTHEQANYLDETQAGEPPCFYNLVENRLLRLVPVPVAAETAGARALFALKPTPTATQLPEILLHDYAEGLAEGALWYLLASPGTPYADPAGAKAHRQAFYGAIGQASVDTARGFARTALEAVPCW